MSELSGNSVGFTEECCQSFSENPTQIFDGDAQKG